MNRTRGQVRAGVLAAVSLAAVLMVSCTPGNGQPPPAPDVDHHNITVWTTETLPDRMAKLRVVVGAFTSATGVKADLVTVPSHRFNQVLTSSAASGDLPDVMASLSLGQVRTMAAAGHIDYKTNAAIVQSLGEQTWAARALELTRDKGQQLAVPGSAWHQLIYYRKDLFAQAGLRAPRTYADIVAAAKKLDSPGLAGMVAANKTGQAFTQQSFENIALGNGCEMVDAKAGITFDSPQCVAALGFYRDLLKNYSVPGIQDIDTVRSAYFAGKAAMAIWPTNMLDELAGTRTDARPSCAECAKDPLFLARNTGVVAGLQGPDGQQPAHFGEVISWTVTADSDAEPARRFVEYFLTDGYVDWLAIAPEEGVPVRSGSTANPAEYADAWMSIPVAAGRTERFGSVYAKDVLSTLLQGSNDLKHWGIVQGHGDLAGAAMAELPIAKAASDVAAGRAQPQAAATKAAASLRSILKSLK
ncbi:extracellular solute-binding protein [uncultured Arthrobacter sp.]|uniref:ABC transporter substrate-binding protein n=1 Tax=uncultured Arthrobacter sp. TaxID=114050 RepID=UPI0028D74674|nr:extracellular solute-binding protein [uncultured Arthrobacter sp.]